MTRAVSRVWCTISMDTQALLRDLGERLGGSASVRNVYGDPVTAGGRTVIPVARVFYTFGGGGGRGRQDQPDSSRGGGAGAGGMVAASPVGALEVTAEGARFVGVHDAKLLALAAAAGFAVGAMLGLAAAFARK